MKIDARGASIWSKYDFSNLLFQHNKKSARRQGASMDTTINLELETDRTVWER